MITVVGSLNIDLNIDLPHFPKQGETLQSQQFTFSYGGKGGNQAIAVSRLQEKVNFIGALGNDTYGKAYWQQLKREQVNTDGIVMLEDTATGTAIVMHAQQDNAIIIVPGANGALTKAHIAKQQQILLDSQLIIMQFEVNDDVISAVLKIAAEKHIPVILNPAPFRPFPKEWLDNVTYLTPNETEYAEMVKMGMVVPEEKLILTLGKQGASYFDTACNKRITVSTPKVKTVDTTGAGDTFNGALAVSLVQEKSLQEACAYAVAAASLSTQHHQAQTGMPTPDQVAAILNDN